jgi:zinc/manganese transport system substrate-binding protein
MRITAAHTRAIVPQPRAVLLGLVAFAVLAIRPVSAQLKMVTSTTDLADIASSIGGSHVRVDHIGEGFQDPHFIEAKPSFILKMRDADIWAFVGLDLEIGWMPLLLQGARNPKIQPGGTGYVDVSKAIPVLDIPSGQVDRSQGDVHPLGNPHYQLDPENGKRIGALFASKFSALDPAHAAEYASNLAAFNRQVDAVHRDLAPQLAQIAGKPIIAWHTSWRYFAQYTGANIVGFMEPKPGVPPSPSHLAGLIQTMRRTGAKVIVMEPYFDRRLADFVVRNVPGAQVLVLAPSVGGLPGVGSYVQLIRTDVTALARALP